MAVEWLLVGGIAWLIGNRLSAREVKRRRAVLSAIAKLERQIEKVENKPETGWFGIDERTRMKEIRRLEREIALLRALL